MKKQVLKWFSHGSWMLALLFMSVSCEESFAPQSKTKLSVTARGNAEIMAASQDILNITGAGMINQGISYGRVAEDDHDEDYLCGATVSKTITLNHALADSLIVEGAITIDFGDGSACGDSSDHRPSGSITTEFTISMNLKTHQYASIETITLDEFKRGAKSLSGTFIARAASGGQQWLDIIDAELTYLPHDAEDDDDDEGDEEADTVVSTMMWSGSLTFTYDNAGTFGRDDDTKTMTGSITGTSNGSSFHTEISEDVVFLYGCNRGHYPVSGLVNISSAGVLTMVNFGDSTCDKIYTSTTAGITTELHF
jgi:hypothetical protein